MSDVSIETERSIFLKAIEIEAEAERDAYLEAACAGNPDLRSDLAALLRAHQEPEAMLDTPIVHGTATSLPHFEAPGAVVGPYTLVRQIGDGAFGVVFLAEQEKPVRRQVALKILKPGMDTKEVLARFEAEKHALALMDHPNIARVFDAGVTESGRPYVVMELAQGIPITEYCRKHELPLSRRLRLFIDVCRAIQHAHQKGIIHRDIKPNNVLITEQDAEPIVKVIDFGIAKAMNERPKGQMFLTRCGEMIGTPLYMSPEQAERGILDIDTRSDVYSLGVLLFELLTGTTPCEPERLKEAGFDALGRILFEEDPPRPSRRLSALRRTTETPPKEAAPKYRVSSIRADLDWIVMKALEKDRTRRYDSAKELGDDVGRFLNDEPIHAIPPSTAYRIQKLAHRHKTAIIASCLIIVALIAATVVSVVMAFQAIRAQKDTETTHEELVTAIEQLADFYTKQRRHRVAETLYDRVLDDRGRQLSLNHPRMLGIRFQRELSVFAQGRKEEAVDRMEKVLEGREQVLGRKHPDTQRTMCALAYGYTCVSYEMTCSLDRTEADTKEALRLAQRAATLNPGARTWWLLAWTQYLSGNLEESRFALGKLLENRRIAPCCPQYTYLAALLAYRNGDQREAEDWLHVSRKLTRGIPPKESDLSGLGFAICPVAAEAVALIGGGGEWPPEGWSPEQDIQVLSRLIAKHPDLCFLRYYRSCSRSTLGKWEGALADSEKAMELRPDQWDYYYFNASLLLQMGEHARYETLCDRMIEKFGNVGADVRVDVVRYCGLRPLSSERQRKLLELADRTYSQWKYLDSRLGKGVAAYRCGRYEEAIAVLPDYRPDQVKGLMAMLFRAMAYEKLGEVVKSRSLLDKSRKSMAFWAPKPLGPDASWYVECPHQWSMLNMLLREAEDLIEPEQVVTNVQPDAEALRNEWGP